MLCVFFGCSWIDDGIIYIHTWRNAVEFGIFIVVRFLL